MRYDPTGKTTYRDTARYRYRTFKVSIVDYSRRLFSNTGLSLLGDGDDVPQLRDVQLHLVDRLPEAAALVLHRGRRLFGEEVHLRDGHPRPAGNVCKVRASRASQASDRSRAASPRANQSATYQLSLAQSEQLSPVPPPTPSHPPPLDWGV